MRSALVILAAGAGSRFAGPTHKLLAGLNGRPVWEHAVAHALDAAGERPVAVVTGAQAIRGPLLDRVTHLVNRAWASGQASSLAAGLDWATTLGVDAVVIGLADQPFIPAETWTRILDAPPTTPIVAARYRGRPGPHPVRLDRAVWADLDNTGDRGAGPLMRSRPRLVTWVECLGSTADIDTQEDLTRWTSC